MIMTNIEPRQIAGAPLPVLGYYAFSPTVQSRRRITVALFTRTIALPTYEICFGYLIQPRLVPRHCVPLLKAQVPVLEKVQ
jgi:hypothetical protein